MMRRSLVLTRETEPNGAGGDGRRARPVLPPSNLSQATA